jgi:hypothetical protein
MLNGRSDVCKGSGLLANSRNTKSKKVLEASALTNF